MWKKFWHWLRMEEEDKSGWQSKNKVLRMGVGGRYSEGIAMFPLKEAMTLDDILQVSHKRADGRYETCFVTVKELKEAIINL